MSFGGPIDSMQSAYKANNRLLRHRDRLRQKLKVSSAKKAGEGKVEVNPRASIQTETLQKKDYGRLIKWLKLTSFLIVLSLLFWVLWTFDWSPIIQAIQ